MSLMQTVFLAALIAAAAAAQPAADPYYALSQSVVRLWRYTERTGRPEPANPVGTGFFVTHHGSLYLVSAGHMSQAGDLMARVPLAGGGQRDLMLPRTAWTAHPAAASAGRGVKGPDVAVVRLAEPEGWQPVTLALNDAPDIDPLDEILVAGYPGSFAAEAPVQRPLLRKGIVAMKGDAPYVRYAGENAMADARVRVLDVLTLPGNSGSPVFAAAQFPRRKLLVGMVTAGDQDLSVAYAEPLSRIREAILHAEAAASTQSALWR